MSRRSMHLTQLALRKFQLELLIKFVIFPWAMTVTTAGNMAKTGKNCKSAEKCTLVSSRSSCWQQQHV